MILRQIKRVIRVDSRYESIYVHISVVYIHIFSIRISLVEFFSIFDPLLDDFGSPIPSVQNLHPVRSSLLLLQDELEPHDIVAERITVLHGLPLAVHPPVLPAPHPKQFQIAPHTHL